MDEILNLIESVSEVFSSYSFKTRSNNSKTLNIYFFPILSFFVPPTSKKLRGILIWARPSVRPSVTPFVGCKTREPIELGT